MCKCTLGFAHMQRDESIVRTTNTKGFPVKESGAVIHSNLFSDWVHEGVLSLWHWQYFCVFETHTHSHIYCTRHTVWQAVGDPAVREKQTGGRWNSKIPLEYSVQLIYYYSLRLKSKQKDTYWIFLSIVTTDIRSGCMGSTYGNSRMRIFLSTVEKQSTWQRITVSQLLCWIRWVRQGIYMTMRRCRTGQRRSDIFDLYNCPSSLSLSWQFWII